MKYLFARRQISHWSATIAFVVALTACGSTIEGAVDSSFPTVSSSVPSSTATDPSSEPEEEPEEGPAAEGEQTAPTVTEGAECGPRGATAAFSDGATAYCARLQYTDGAAWSRDPDLAPNPAVDEHLRQRTPEVGYGCSPSQSGQSAIDLSGVEVICNGYIWEAVYAGPQLGDPCIGADIGRTAIDGAGTAIMCDNYVWTHDVGQEPTHPWVDDQVAMADCLEEHTHDECLEILGFGQ